MRSLLAIVGGSLLLSAKVMAQVTGQWDFKQGNLAATVGQDLAYFDGPGGATEQASRFGTTSDLGIAHVAGEAVAVMRVPKNSAAMGLVLRPGMAANGGGVLVNQYSLVMDVLFPSESAGKNRALLQCEDPFANLVDAAIQVGTTDGVGVGGISHGTLTANQWHRLVVTVNLAATPPVMTKYVNGTWVGEQFLGAGIDGRWALSDRTSALGSDAALLFTDRNGNSEVLYVSSLQVHNQVLPPTYVAALGGASPNKIPATVVPRALLGAVRPEPGDPVVVPGQPLEVQIFEGANPIEVSQVKWALDGVLVSPTVSRPSSGLVVLRHDPGMLPPSSRHTVSLKFFDPSVSAEVDAGEWSFTMAPYNLPAIDPSLGSLLYLPFDETEAAQGGAVTDRSPEGNHGVLRLQEETGDHKIPGIVGQALDFKAEQFNYVELSKPWSALPNSFSVWVKVSGSIPDATRVGVILGTFNAANNINWELHTSGRPRLWWNNGSPDWNVSGFDFRTDKWEHLAIVRNPASDTLTLYRNGRRVASRTGVGSNILPTVPSYVGADRRGSSSPYFKGALDDLAVFERPLTDVEVWRLYARSLSLPKYMFAAPQVIEVQPADGAGRQGLRPRIAARIDPIHSTAGLDRSSVTLTINGTAVPLVLQDEAGYVVVSHDPGTPFAASSTNRVLLSYRSTGTPSLLVEHAWSFVTASLPTVDQPLLDRSVIEGATVSFEVVASTTPPTTYQWRRNGANLAGATNVTLVLTNVQSSAAGRYDVVIVDAIGQVSSRSALLEVKGSLPSDPAESLRIGLNAHWPFDSDFKSPVPGFDAAPRNGAALVTEARIGAGSVAFRQDLQQSVGVARAVIADRSLTYSVAGWFKVTGGTGRRFLWETAPANWAISSEITPAGTLKAFARNANDVSRDLDTLIEPGTGGWHHAAVVFDAALGEASIYYDGVRFEQPLLLEQGIGTGPTTGFNIGTYRAADARFFDGLIDDVAVWDRPLRAEEVAWLAAGHGVPAPLPPVQNPLVIVQSPKDTEGWLGSTVFLSVSATGTPPLSYQWKRDGAAISGATSSNLVLALPDTASGGRFTVSVSDASQTQESSPATVTVRSLPTDVRESLGAGLAARWAFDGDFTSSVPGFDGTPIRGASLSPIAKVGSGSVSLSQAAQQYVDVNARVIPDSTLTYSVAGWFRPGGGTGRRFLWETAPSNWAISAEISAAGNLQVFTRQTILNSLSINTLVSPAVGEWRHLATVFDARAGEVRVYVDGVRVNVPFPIQQGTGTAPTTGFHIGSYRAGDGRFFEGQIDEVGVWHRLLNEAEITHLAAGHAIVSTMSPDQAKFTRATRTLEGIQLEWQGGRAPYRVEYRSDLATGAWSTLAEGIQATRTIDSAANEAVRFYRVVSTP
jgi:hypothetical protein